MRRDGGMPCFAAWAVWAWMSIFALPSLFAEDSPKSPYITWPPIEPDKTIAAWLIKMHVDTDARFVFAERGTTVSNGIPFDVPGSQYARDHRRCTSEAVIQLHDIQDEHALKLADLARRIEMAYWAAEFTTEETLIITKISHISSTTTNIETGFSEAMQLLDK